MKLDRVTMTGADDETPIKDLVALSKEYPFVEWGILASPKRAGTPRFPSAIWQKALADEIKAQPGPGTWISAHLCGGYVRSVLDRGELAVDEIPVWPVASRVQLNFHAEPHTCEPGPFIDGIVAWKRPVIFQDDGVNTDIFNHARWAGVDAAVLFDRSHGGGVVPGQWPEARLLVHCGYAGGLGPETIAAELPKIAQAANGARIWIDMEGRVRTNEHFDLEKVRTVLDYCASAKRRTQEASA